jgi:hypothetical protein
VFRAVCRQPFRYAPERPTTGKVRVARDTGVMTRGAYNLSLRCGCHVRIWFSSLNGDFPSIDLKVKKQPDAVITHWATRSTVIGVDDAYCP